MTYIFTTHISTHTPTPTRTPTHTHTHNSYIHKQVYICTYNIYICIYVNIYIYIYIYICVFLQFTFLFHINTFNCEVNLQLLKMLHSKKGNHTAIQSKVIFSSLLKKTGHYVYQKSRPVIWLTMYLLSVYHFNTESGKYFQFQVKKISNFTLKPTNI